MPKQPTPVTLHYAPDDKACRGLRKLYSEAFPAQHRFISYPYFMPTSDCKSRPKWMQFEDGDRFASSPDYWSSQAAQDDCRDADIIIFHSLQNPFLNILHLAPRSALIIWNSWGGDEYKFLPDYLESALVFPATLRASNFQPRDGPNPLDTGHAASSQSWLARKLQALQTAWRHVRPPALTTPWARIDYFSGQSAVYSGLRRNLPGFRAAHLRLDWYALEPDKQLIVDPEPGPDVQVGHCAWPTDNHLEMISLLSQADLTGRKVVYPLSYGSDGYAQVVEECSRRVVNGQTIALRRFVPLEEYEALIGNCGTLLMNCARTSGWGNILFHLSRGSRVVLSSRDFLLYELQKHGFVVSPIPSTGRDMEDLLTPLTPSERLRNRQLVSTHFGQRAVQDRISQIFHLWKTTQTAGVNAAASWLYG